MRWKNEIFGLSASKENNCVSSADSEAELPSASLQAPNLQAAAKVPANPHMRKTHARLETFDDRWSRQNVKVHVKHIAKAGFFYLGKFPSMSRVNNLKHFRL